MILTENTIVDDRYKIISKIAEGGMAVIYLANDNQLQKEVVLKVLKSEQARAKEKVERFFQEFELLKSFNHPNIIRVFDKSSTDELHYYSMPHLKGKSLAATLKELHAKNDKKLLAANSINILLQLAKALQCIHEKEIIHHDLNPSNVYVLEEADAEGNIVQLIDFGISLLKGSHSTDQSFAGTLHYKAPEQTKHKQLDFSSDIYAFGVVAYELFAGEKPFDVKGDVSGVQLFNGVVMMHNFKQVPEIKKLPFQISKTINRMIQICMDKEPSHRYENMQQIIDRLEDCYADLEKKSNLLSLLIGK